MLDDSRLAATDPTRWLDAHGDYLFRYAMKHLRDAASAEDVVQETLLAAYQARDRYSGNATERTWLIGILKHKIADLFRKRSREVPLADYQTDSQEPASQLFDERGEWIASQAAWGDPDAMLEQKRFWETFARCFDNLSPKLSAAFSLREFSGLSIEELCDTLNISPNNCSVMLYRARIALKECLEIRWADDMAWRDA